MSHLPLAVIPLDQNNTVLDGSARAAAALQRFGKFQHLLIFKGGGRRRP